NRVGEGLVGQKRLHFIVIAIFAQGHYFNPTTDPIVDKELSVVVIGVAGFLVIQIRMIHRSRHGVTATATQLRELFRLGVRIPNEGRLRRRKFAQACVVWRLVEGLFGIKIISAFPGFVVVRAIGIIIANEERPSMEPGLAGLVDFVVATRATLLVVIRSVWPHVTPIEIAILLVYGNPISVARAHGVDLRSRTFFSFREEVALRNFVATILQYADAKYASP